MTDDPKTPAPAEAPTAPPEEGWKPEQSRGRILLFGSLVLVGALAILYAWGLPPFRPASQTTDNAYVRGQTTIIAPQVGGYVTEVLVQDFERVKAGQLLVRIDDRIYRERVAQGAASVAAQSANLDNSAQSLRSAEAQVRLQDAATASARAQLARAQADMRRVNELVDAGSVSLRERDQTLAALRQAEAAVRQAEAQRAIAAEQLRSVGVGRGGLEAGVANAKAQRELAGIDLQNSAIRAPRDGRLSEVSVRVGQLVSPGTQLMYLVPERHWVVANFKETQTAGIRIGQSATLRIDALGGAKLKGHVERIAPAAGSEFSIIKPDTGSGNFVKVPQRIAVRIRIDDGQALSQRLGPGMSVVATVHTGRP
ncbi:MULTISPECIES: HlyD family secretion protein [Sphingopyxis]|uniref:HlyD family secretion protein n=1 Tax=Sphingopyxis granuli TaxID=267128 RepID=A0AA86GT64_9SPHN|nr:MULTISPECIES: HlyD family secretion protein [Sphingopyxis]AMG76460.1 HlyD family secretion protein [Sphingopyxis granuli]APW74007.1 secretion protein HlyD [Sphingopyxis granuli]AVA15338.1 HlyD family secretion protein [Sphingopyxis sp. MG]QUM72682.1 HlyD family secretion protein [Sphingopyxis granuli]